MYQLNYFKGIKQDYDPIICIKLSNSIKYSTQKQNNKFDWSAH